MKRLLIGFALAFALYPSPALMAQAKLSEYLATCPLLDEKLRAEAVQAVEAIENTPQTVTSYTAQTSTISAVAIHLLPLVNGTDLIATVEYVHAPIKDSYLRAYSPSWTELPIKLIDQMPTAKDFAPQGDSPAHIRLRQLLYPLHLDMTISDNRLSITPVLPLTLSDQEDDALVALAATLPTLHYKWGGSAFLPETK